MNSPNPARFVLQVESDETDSEENRDAMARQLLQEIRDELQNVSAADLVTAESASVGAKNAEVVTIGALAVTLLPTLLPQLVEFVKAWTLRGHGRTVKVKLEPQNSGVEVEFDPSSMSPNDVAQLVRDLSDSTRVNASAAGSREERPRQTDAR